MRSGEANIEADRLALWFGSAFDAGRAETEASVGNATQFQTYGDETERIVVDQQFSQKDFSKLGNVEHVAEDPPRKFSLDLLHQRT